MTSTVRSSQPSPHQQDSGPGVLGGHGERLTPSPRPRQGGRLTRASAGTREGHRRQAEPFSISVPAVTAVGGACSRVTGDTPALLTQLRSGLLRGASPTSTPGSTSCVSAFNNLTSGKNAALSRCLHHSDVQQHGEQTRGSKPNERVHTRGAPGGGQSRRVHTRRAPRPRGPPSPSRSPSALLRPRQWSQPLSPAAGTQLSKFYTTKREKETTPAAHPRGLPRPQHLHR